MEGNQKIRTTTTSCSSWSNIIYSMSGEDMKHQHDPSPSCNSHWFWGRKNLIEIFTPNIFWVNHPLLPDPFKRRTSRSRKTGFCVIHWHSQHILTLWFYTNNWYFHSAQKLQYETIVIEIYSCNTEEGILRPPFMSNYVDINIYF